jgi:peroxiredoxin
MKRRDVVITVSAFAIFAALVFSAYHWAPNSSSRADALTTVSGQNSSFAVEGGIAPDFSLQTLDGRAVKLSDFRGKIVLLNFWATWCAPCRVEMPWLIELYKNYHSQGFEIVGVSVDDPGEQRSVERFVKEMGVNYTILLGTNPVADLYGGARLLPHTFFISRDGKITKSFIGLQDKSEIEATIREMLAAPPR